MKPFRWSILKKQAGEPRLLRHLFSAALMLPMTWTLSAADGQYHLLDRYGTEGRKAFAVLSKVEVQRHLVLSSNQLMRIKEIRNLEPKAVPGASNLLATTGQTMNAEQRLRRYTELNEFAERFKLGRYYSILSTEQSNRLWQIMLQVQGLKVLVSNPELAAALRVSSEQSKRLNEILTKHEGQLDSLYQRFRRQTIAGFPPGETFESRSLEVKTLIDSICASESRREKDLVVVLSADQRKGWTQMRGTLLPIWWSYDDFLSWYD